jgi:hypothetical protein
MARTISVVQEPAYFEALGRFVNEFAAVESALLFALKTYAKVSWPIARAIFSGARVETAIDFVKRICDASDPGQERREELDDVFKQLRAISEIRNSLLHYGSATFSDRGRVTSNVRIAHVPTRIREYPVSVTIINGMAADLQKISYHLTLQCLRPDASFAERAAEIPEIAGAWRYKPAQQPRARQGNQTPPRSRRPRGREE